MVRMFAVHSVSEYDPWRQAYDAFDDERRSMGVTGDAVFRTLDDPNEITVWHDFETKEAAEAFASSPRLREVMANAGVVGAPKIWFADQA